MPARTGCSGCSRGRCGRRRGPPRSTSPTGPCPGDPGTGSPPARATRAERDYDWAFLRIIPPADEATRNHWLLIRRRIRDGELAFYRCWSPKPATLATLVRVAGTV
jgi:hypothetical protein